MSQPTPPVVAPSPEFSRDGAEKELREAAANYQKDPTAAHLQEVHRQAVRMIAYAPERSKDVMPLLKELLPEASTPPPTPASPTKS